MKRTIKLTENELHRIIKESVKQVLKENSYDDILKSNQNRGNAFWSDPKIEQLQKMGVDKYCISCLQNWYEDVSNVPFEVLKQDVQRLKDNYVNDADDYSDYNNSFKHPTQQSILRGQMVYGDD